MSETMKAMVLTGHGGMEKLLYHTDWPRPDTDPDQHGLRDYDRHRMPHAA